MDPDLTNMQEDIVETLLIDGAGSPKSLHMMLGYERPSISNALSDLSEYGLVYDKGGAVYTLTPEGITVARSVHRQTED